MKKTIAIVLAVVLCAGMLLAGCAPRYETAPNEQKDVRWISYDYSFCINPADDGKGYYTFNDKRYNIQVSFDGAMMKAVDTDNSNTELFSGDWMYETTDGKNELLYLYNLSFNKKDYPEMENNFSEFVNLKKEKI